MQTTIIANETSSATLTSTSSPRNNSETMTTIMENQTSSVTPLSTSSTTTNGTDNAETEFRVVVISVSVSVAIVIFLVLLVVICLCRARRKKRKEVALKNISTSVLSATPSRKPLKDDVMESERFTPAPPSGSFPATDHTDDLE
ncbi:hypothetical protein BaRGS_00021870 [Batillaria attramentaria]|uniref:Uncharacterized protein n=1 Tax=Batillaria attramentaria TaxID=370345 RepID=A0ABD0KI98_9CAEN